MEKVVIKESEHALKESVFTCHKWIEPVSRSRPARLQVQRSREQLATPLPDNEQLAIKPDKPSQGNWTLLTTTGQHSEAATDTDVFMVVYGTRCNTEPLRLQDYLEQSPAAAAAAAERPKQSRESKKKGGTKQQPKKEEPKPFAPGQVDTFKVGCMVEYDFLFFGF